MLLRSAILIIVSIFLAACAQEQPAPIDTPSPTEIIPTETVTVEPSATATLAARSTLPPEWTVAPPTDASAANTVDSDNTANSAAEAPTMTAAPPLELQAPVPNDTLDAACESFGPDSDRNVRTYRAGEDATVYWYPVMGAEFYSITLTDETGEAVVTNYTSETGYVFSADLFEDGGLYGWEAYPVNSVGQQMCLTRGAELFPEFLN